MMIILTALVFRHTAVILVPVEPVHTDALGSAGVSPGAFLRFPDIGAGLEDTRRGTGAVDFVWSSAFYWGCKITCPFN